MCIYTFYFIQFNLLIKQKLRLRNILVSLLLFVATVIIAAVLDLISDNKALSLKSVLHPFSFLFDVLFLGGIGFCIRGLIEHFNEKEKRIEMKQKQLESEIGLLRAQINPHFLFNTLNNIDAVIRKDSQKASELLIKLSEQMRFMLYESNTDYIQLISELKFINDYISLQKLRIRNQEAVLYTSEGNFESVLIPPMIFIPFIENAFKHCSDMEKDGAIKVGVRYNRNNIVFESENLFDPDEKSLHGKSEGGIGVDLTKRRLNIIFPGKHELIINTKPPVYKVFLKIIFNDN